MTIVSVWSDRLSDFRSEACYLASTKDATYDAVNNSYASSTLDWSIEYDLHQRIKQNIEKPIYENHKKLKTLG